MHIPDYTGRMAKRDVPMTPAQRTLFAAVLAILLLVAFVASASCTQPKTTNLPSVEPPAVARLVMSEDGEEVGSCTAWKVEGRNLAVTAGHCCSEPSVKYHMVSGAAVAGAEAVPLVVDLTHDVCVMRAEMRGDAIPMALKDPEPGDAVWTYGFPRRTPLISTGIWSGRDGDGQGIASVACAGGASGSPILDPSGRAVGVLVAGYPSMSNIAFIAPLEWLRLAVVAARGK